MDHPFDEMSPELQEKIAKTTVALLDKHTSEIDNLRAERDKKLQTYKLVVSEDAVTRCKCFNFYPGQNAYNFCPYCGRDLR